MISLLCDGRQGRQRVQLLAVILGVSLTSGWLFEQELNRNLPQLRQLLVGLNLGRDDGANVVKSQSGSALVDQAGLGSLNRQQRENGGDLSFFVRSKATPGYMRTVAFTTFDGAIWKNPWTRLASHAVDGISSCAGNNLIARVT